MSKVLSEKKSVASKKTNNCIYGEPIALRTVEACQYLNMNRKQLEACRRSGRIKCVRVGRIYFYPISCLNDFIERNIGKEITKDGLVIGEC